MDSVKKITPPTPSYEEGVERTVVVNGQEIVLPDSARLTDLLRSLSMDLPYVLVEWNGEALPKDEIPSITLKHGDRLEIVRPVAGG